MAVMASPQPEAAPAAVKVVDSTLDQAVRPETNGHTSPAPVVNGKTESTPDAETITGNETQNTDAVTSNQSISTKPDEIETEEPTQVETTQTQDTSIAAAEDVDMGDAPEASATAESKDKKEASPVDAAAETAKEPEPTPEAAASPKPEEPKKDVEMQDATESAKPNGAGEEAQPAANAADPADKPSEKATPPPVGEEAQTTSLSQLAIDSKDETDGDVAMADVPASTATKNVREREDDTPDEPAAKRARTEPSEDEIPPAPAPEPSAAPVSDVPAKSEQDIIHQAFRGVPQWNAEEVNDRKITKHHNREYRRILAGAKKTKAGAGFREAVAKLWPQLAESYIARVDKPMDIGLMDRTLRDTEDYKTLRDLKNDLVLLYYNTYIYNGALHDVTLAGKTAVEQIWQKLVDVPEEGSKPKPFAKHNPSRHSEPRPASHAPPAPAPAKKESRPAPGSPSSRIEAEAYAVPPGGVPQVRRASTQNENDRPKRTIHPPKNRDIDYTAMQNFNKKKLPLELQFAYDSVNELMDLKHEIINGPFLAPVDPVALQIPNYWSIIKKPMDLSTIKSKLVTGEYQTLQQVQQDVKLIVANCNKFNGPEHPVTYQATQLGELAKTQWAKKDQWLAKNTPAKIIDADSSGESEDESDEEEQAPAAKVPSSTAVAQLEKRLADETSKLSEMLINTETSDDTMIDVQRTVVSAIRKRLIEEKDKVPAQKSDKSGKSKPAKAGGKAKVGAGGSKKLGAAPTQKSRAAGPKKKRAMTQAEKDAIANGINDLDENNITKAIDIIKKDTGQSENDSGELELEIDQLTNDALHKLWDLLKKVLPNFASSMPARDVSPVSNGQAKQPKSSKPKKNKPMNAREQEARIAELERLKQSYAAPGQEPDREPEMPLHPLREDSSDSEEE